MTGSTVVPPTEGVRLPTLSVVLPTYNAASWLPGTLARLRDAIAEASWPDVQIVVVDDGSTDNTQDILRDDQGTPALTVVCQANAGRFLAREAGLRAATGELVLFIDSRVHAHPDSLRFVAEQLLDHPERRVWNGHVVTATGASHVTRFWEAITFVAWRRYLREPRLMSYGAEEYDHFPKGTTYFLAPRSMLCDAIASFDSAFGDLRHANDDTLMIRPLVEHERIFLSPEFSCTYHPRDNSRKFLAHSFHRGTVFVDGYYRPGTRFYRPLQAVMLAAPVAVGLAILRPRFAVSMVAGGSVALGAGSLALGVPRRNALALVLLSPIFGVAYGSGIVRGMALRISGKKRGGE
jgi:glycosyltransferase involved in cell wall biosynthesis